MGQTADQRAAQDTLNNSIGTNGVAVALDGVEKVVTGKVAGFLPGDGAVYTISAATTTSTDSRAENPLGAFACPMACACKDVTLTSVGGVTHIVLG